MKPASAIKKATIGAFEPFEELGGAVKPLGQDALKQFFGKDFGFGGFGEPGVPSSHSQTIAGEDLNERRKKNHLQKIDHNDQNHSNEEAVRIQKVMAEYQKHDSKQNAEQNQMHEEYAQMQEEVVKLAKAAGVETKIHVENSPKKLGKIDFKLLTSIIRSLRIKAENSKSGQDISAQRQNAKRGTGMMAWVSGNQGKIHEQGTMQLQG
jgi:hypothetical protein